MATYTPSRLARYAVPSLAAAAVALSAFSMPAHAAAPDTPPGDTTAKFVMNGSGLDRVVPDKKDDSRRSAGNYKMKLDDGTDVYAFCIDFNLDVDKKGVYRVVDWKTAPKSVKVLAKASFIAENHKKIGKRYEENTWENAAAQVAIWELTNSKAVDASTLGNTKFAKRVDQLVAAAEAAPNPEPVIEYNLEGAKSVKDVDGVSYDVVSGKVTSSTGAPAVAVDVVFTVGEETHTVKTDEEGVAALEVAGVDKKREVKMTYVADVAPGAVLMPDKKDAQPLILADGFQVTKEQSVQLAATVNAPETPVKEKPKKDKPKKDKPVVKEPTEKTPEVTVTPEPKVEQVPTVLPKTGAGIAGLIAAGLGTIGAGFAGLRYFRRKK